MEPRDLVEQNLICLVSKTIGTDWQICTLTCDHNVDINRLRLSIEHKVARFRCLLTSHHSSTPKKITHKTLIIQGQRMKVWFWSPEKRTLCLRSECVFFCSPLSFSGPNWPMGYHCSGQTWAELMEVCGQCQPAHSVPWRWLCDGEGCGGLSKIVHANLPPQCHPPQTNKASCRDYEAPWSSNKALFPERDGIWGVGYPLNSLLWVWSSTILINPLSREATQAKIGFSIFFVQSLILRILHQQPPKLYPAKKSKLFSKYSVQ